MMDFSEALILLKQGFKMAREGWNGKGMWLFYMPGYPGGVPANENTACAMGVPVGTEVRVLPYISMKTVDGSIVPWLASQTDLLANDWVQVQG